MNDKLLVKIDDNPDYYKIYYLCAENEDDYYNGNHDVFATYSINKNTCTNLIEEIKNYDTYFSDKEIVVVEY